MFKTSIKLFLLTSIFYTQLFLNAFAMERDDEDKNNNSIIKKNIKNEEKIKNEEPPQDVPIGSIISFSGENAPNGWLICDGQELECSKYKKLYEIIGKTYTSIDLDINRIDYGKQKINENKELIEKISKLHEGYFCLPDLRGRVIVGPENDSKRVNADNILGKTGGEEKHQLIVDEMPSHTHGIKTPTIQKPPYFWSTSSTGGIGIPQAHDDNTKTKGDDKPHNNMQPYLVLNYIIKAEENNDLDNLKKKIKKLEIQINPAKRWKARFCDTNKDWKPYTNANWTPVTFNYFEAQERFEGEDTLKSNLSTIEIPEDGVYELLAHYYWRSDSKGATAPYTGIAINTPTNMKGCYKQHHLLLPHCVDSGSLNRTTYLYKGEKVMVSIFGQPNAEYYLGGFQFEIEKLH